MAVRGGSSTRTPRAQVARARGALGGVVDGLEPVTGPVRRFLGPVTSLGWTIAVIGAAAWWLGAQLGWEELLILAGACVVALVLGLLSTIGRLGLDIDVAVEPNRVVVGGDAVGRVEVTNNRSRPTLGTRVEVPVGAGVASFEVGSLGAGEQFQEPFVIPTLRRSIIPIGPARSVKGDALGIARREVVSGQRIDLYVHPRTSLLPTLTAGWVRDLEGTTTQDLSNSDVAFHTLREYVPGDDRRHIHWRTTARLGTLMVRQFVDTRRTHLGLVLSSDHSDWADDDEFELGVSVLGSLGRTALMQDQEVTALSGAHPLPSHAPTLLLDALSGIEPDQDGLPLRELVQRSLLFTRGVTVVGLVVGSRVDPRVVRAACESYGPDMVVLALRCRIGAEVRRQRIGNVSLLEIGRLEDLGRVLSVVGAGR